MLDYDGLRGILDWLPTGVLFATPAGEIPLCNAKAPELLGCDALDILEKGIAAVPASTGIPAAWESLRSAERREESVEFAQGRRRLSATLIQGGHVLFGEPLLMILVSDISDRERLHELRDGVLPELLRRARGPLTSIKTALAVLGSSRHASLPEAAREVVGLGDAEVRRLHGLLGDMSELLALEGSAPGGDLYLENVDLRALLSRCARAAVKTSHGRGREIVLADPADDAPAEAIADLEKLRLILDHLLANALAYSDPAGPAVRITVRAAGSRQAEIRVEDAGIGIPPEEMPRIFERFFRGGHPEVAGKEGSGLGLFISKRYAELMGGSLRLESEPGRGTAAILVLPALVRDAAGERDR